MATAAALTYAEDQAFYRRMAVWISVIIIFGFVQFSARGIVDIRAVPVWVHVHGVVFVGWLALFIAQNVLAERGSLVLHRRLGWLGVGLAAVMVVLGSYTGIRAVELGRQPPFFSPPYFLMLTLVGIFTFGGLVAAAVVRRRDTEWHRRLMLCATVILLEPAFGRMLPMPLIGGEAGEWYVLVIQLLVVGIAMWHDRKWRGQIHPALLWGAGVIIAAHAMISLLSRTSPVVALAQTLSGAS